MSKSCRVVGRWFMVDSGDIIVRIKDYERGFAGDYASEKPPSPAEVKRGIHEDFPGLNPRIVTSKSGRSGRIVSCRRR